MVDLRTTLTIKSNNNANSANFHFSREVKHIIIASISLSHSFTLLHHTTSLTHSLTRSLNSDLYYIFCCIFLPATSATPD